MVILVTRPYEDSLTFVHALSAYGIKSMIAPLLKIQAVPVPFLSILDPQAVVLTSPHAFYALNIYHLHPPYVFAVGRRVQKLWQENGPKSSQLIVSEIGITGLLKPLKETLNPKGSGVIYLKGRHTTYDLKPEDVCFLPLEQVVCYEAHPETAFKADVYQALKSHAIQGVTFFSLRTLEIFCKMCKEHALFFHKIVAYCISDKVAYKAKEMGFQKVITSCYPDEAHMIQGIIDYDKA
jgi:uroporphyrinogen-III synthase